jgi:hypothetical protein
MRALNWLGGAALAALAAMAFVGASSAMASNTLLCNNDEAPSFSEAAPSRVASMLRVIVRRPRLAAAQSPGRRGSLSADQRRST